MRHSEKEISLSNDRADLPAELSDALHRPRSLRWLSYPLDTERFCESATTLRHNLSGDFPCDRSALLYRGQYRDQFQSDHDINMRSNVWDRTSVPIAQVRDQWPMD